MDSDKSNCEHMDIRKACDILMISHFNGADIKIECMKDTDGTIFQMECRPNILKSLEIQPKFAEISEPSAFFKVSGGTMERAAFIDIGPSAVKKVMLELDIATGKATLKAE